MGQMQRAYFEGLGFTQPAHLHDIGCRGKEAFESHDAATACLKRISGRRKDHSRLVGQRVYRCRLCRKWHAGAKRT